MTTENLKQRLDRLPGMGLLIARLGQVPFLDLLNAIHDGGGCPFPVRATGQRLFDCLPRLECWEQARRMTVLAVRLIDGLPVCHYYVVDKCA